MLSVCRTALVLALNVTLHGSSTNMQSVQVPEVPAANIRSFVEQQKPQNNEEFRERRGEAKRNMEQEKKSI